jgi:hypothetical protein
MAVVCENEQMGNIIIAAASSMFLFVFISVEFYFFDTPKIEGQK